MFAAVSLVAAVSCGFAESADEPLKAAALRDALPDSEGLPGFTAKPQSEPLLEKQDVVTVDEPACRPIVDVMSVRPRHAREAMVWATLDGKGSSVEGSLTLSSHTPDDAEAWMRELKEARAKCTEFRATSKRGWSYGFTVDPLPPVSAGDDSIAYVLTNAEAPDGKGNSVTVVRTGGTFATYLLAGEPGPVAAEAAEKQHEALRRAAE
ncbi:hypothetical protein AB0B50_19500 [Streptomyces sp. NPDC041068]|uniref:hypothetical protein n=1 Tax=Streptomyces sp. NPDC041068 TaxID=3155130 RepID=UPI0033F1071E